MAPRKQPSAPKAPAKPPGSPEGTSARKKTTFTVWANGFAYEVVVDIDATPAQVAEAFSTGHPFSDIRITAEESK